MKSKSFIIHLLTLCLIPLVISCSQKSTGEGEFTFEENLQQGGVEEPGKISITGQTQKADSEKAIIANYAKQATLDAEVAWTQWVEFKEKYKANIDLTKDFTYNAENISALIEYFKLSDPNFAFLYQALFNSQMNLTIVAQYTFYTFATNATAQQQANLGTQSKNAKSNFDQYGSAFSVFTNSLAVFNRIAIANFNSLGIKIQSVDFGNAGARDFAVYNIEKFAATAIESERHDSEVHYTQTLKVELERIYSSTIFVANNIEYTFLDYKTSNFKVSSDVRSEVAFAPQEAIDRIAMTCPHCFNSKGIEANLSAERKTVDRVESENQEVGLTHNNTSADRELKAEDSTLENNAVGLKANTNKVRVLLNSVDSTLNYNNNTRTNHFNAGTNQGDRESEAVREDLSGADLNRNRQTNDVDRD